MMKNRIFVFVSVCLLGAFCIWISGTKMFTPDAGILTLLTFGTAATLAALGNF